MGSLLCGKCVPGTIPSLFLLFRNLAFGALLILFGTPLLELSTSLGVVKALQCFGDLLENLEKMYSYNTFWELL